MNVHSAAIEWSENFGKERKNREKKNKINVCFFIVVLKIDLLFFRQKNKDPLVKKLLRIDPKRKPKLTKKAGVLTNGFLNSQVLRGFKVFFGGSAGRYGSIQVSQNVSIQPLSLTTINQALRHKEQI